MSQYSSLARSMFLGCLPFKTSWQLLCQHLFYVYTCRRKILRVLILLFLRNEFSWIDLVLWKLKPPNFNPHGLYVIAVHALWNLVTRHFHRQLEWEWDHGVHEHITALKSTQYSHCDKPGFRTREYQRWKAKHFCSCWCWRRKAEKFWLSLKELEESTSNSSTCNHLATM